MVKLEPIDGGASKIAQLLWETHWPFFRRYHVARYFTLFFFFRQGFFVALEPVLELVLVDQAGLELTEICPTLPPECWD